MLYKAATQQWLTLYTHRICFCFYPEEQKSFIFLLPQKMHVFIVCFSSHKPQPRFPLFFSTAEHAFLISTCHCWIPPPWSASPTADIPEGQSEQLPAQRFQPPEHPHRLARAPVPGSASQRERPSSATLSAPPRPAAPGHPGRRDHPEKAGPF